MQWQRTFLTVLAAGLTLVGCESFTIQQKPTAQLNIGLVTGLGGVTEPCGCTSRPLGGLDRMAGLISEKRQDQGFGLIFVGDTFYELDNPAEHLVQQEHEKAKAIAQVLSRLEPMAVLPGKRDVEVGAQRVQTFGLPVLSNPMKSMPSKTQVGSALRTIGGHQVGVVGIAGDGSAEQAEACSQSAQALRNQGAAVVVALIAQGGPEGELLAADIEGADIIVIGGQDEVHEPKVVGDSLVVEAGDKGQRLGQLTFHMEGTGPFRYYDEGRAQKSALKKRMRRLERAIDRMEPGPGRDARKAKLEQLKAKLAAIQPTVPQGRYVTWTLQEIDYEIAAQPWATQILTRYNKSLCKLTMDAHKDLDCLTPDSDKDLYAGTDTCRTCHAAAFEVYEKTAHSHAWMTLENKGKDCDVGCIGCHSVGFEKPGGYCRLQDVTPFVNVGCENCHGPAKSHSLNPGDRSQWSARFTRAPPESTCVVCHNEEHSDQFDFETYLPKVLGPGHQAAATTLQPQ